MNFIEYKNSLSDFQVKMVNDDAIVEGYLSSFNNIDSHGDMMMKGCYTKSLQEHGVNSTSNRKIAHLAYHDTTRPIGSFIELKEDDFGLYFVSKLGKHQDGKDFYELYKSGIIREHSVGFNYIQDKIIKKIDNQGNSYNAISEVKLWEGSAVVFGSNSETPNLTAMKSEEVKDYLDKLNERMEVFIKALKDNNLSDKYNNLCMLELQNIQKCYNSLIRFEPITQLETKTEEEPSIVVKQRKRFI